MPQRRAEISTTLRDVFGFSSFRPHQESVIRAVLDRHDAFVVMPTGGGKSLCYQLPARILPGLCMVISPLISLMQDQCEAAVAIGLEADCLNSARSLEDRRSVHTRLLAGELDLLYISPERFAMDSFASMLSRTQLALIAVDEAHCISEWGHDFRPDYLGLSQLVELFPEVPVTAFTATATHRVQQDIIDRLGLRSPHVVRASFNRANLFYQVVPKTDAQQQILAFVQERRHESGIVYRMTRKSVDATARMLAKHGIRARPYHAGLDDVTRATNQQAFNRDSIEVIVATIAFGMGINKPNVRYVLHGDLPKNIESYYQETGRAGRDGEQAQCLLLFSRGDIPKLLHFIDDMSDEDERQHARRCLQEMVNFAGVHACRRRQLLAYFDESYPDPECGACDVCTGEVETVDATRDAQILLSAIVRTSEAFGINHIVDVVTGADTRRIRDLGHDRIKTYGAGRDRDRHHWRLVVDNLLGQELIRQSGGPYPVLELRPAARAVLSGSTPVLLIRQRQPRPRNVPPPTDGTHDEALFQELRGLRKRLAAQQGVPPYIVFSDRTLRDMARRSPTTDSEMMQVTGVGATKLARYGNAFTSTILAYLGAETVVDLPDDQQLDTH